MLERFLDQIGEVLRLCEDTDGILVVNREGIIEYHRIPLNSYWCSQDTVGRHILELYPELDGESSTILTALRTGRASYNVLQDINNHRGERVLLESTTIPIVVDGRVECVVDSSKYHTIDQRVIRGGEGGGLSTLDRMLTEDPAMLALKSRIRDVAGLDSSVLIYGETGTGKELVATARAAGRDLLSPKTVRPSRPPCWRACFLARKRGATPAPSPARGCWRRRTAAPCSLTKSGNCRLRRSPSCCVSLKIRSSNGLGTISPSGWMCASLPRRTGILPL